MNIPEPSLNERWAKWVLENWYEIDRTMQASDFKALKKLAGEAK